MSRNDSLLSTGLSSAAARRQAQRKLEEKKAREAAQSKLSPNEELIVKLIKEVRDEMKLKKLELIDLDTPDEKVKNTLEVIRATDEAIVSFYNRLSVILRRGKRDE